MLVADRVIERANKLAWDATTSPKAFRTERLPKLRKTTVKIPSALDRIVLVAVRVTWVMIRVV